MAKKPPMLSPSQFIGMKDDIDPKLIPANAFVVATNYNFPNDGLLGMDKILMPKLAKKLSLNTTTLSSAIGTSETSISVVAATNSIDVGLITIDNEQIQYTGINANTYLNCVRAVNGTSLSSHSLGATVNQGYAVSDGNLGIPGSPSTNIFTYCTGIKNIDGTKEYNFIDTNGVAHSYFVIVSEGMMFLFNPDWSVANIFSDVFHAGKFNYAPLRITSGKVSMQVYGNNLYISNGVDYPVVFYGTLYRQQGMGTGAGNYIYFISQMGAPVSINHSVSGALTDTTHKYKLTFVTAGGEEIIGTEHITSSYNSGTNTGNYLYIPFGYSGTITRKLYRTKQGNLSNFFLVANIADNTTQYYTDIIADGSLGAAMPTTINNACPKPYFFGVANGCLYGAKNTLNPTQVYRTDTGIKVFDSANYIEIADQADDNTPVEGIGNDFGSILVATAKNWYLLSPNASDATVTDVTPTRAFCGCKSGYTIKELASFGDFAGGLMFVSSYNDVRIITGMNALPISISVNNMRTQNYGQNIQGSLRLDLLSYTNIYAEYFDYCYHLVIDGNKYVFDIRTQGWTKHVIQTASYKSAPLILAVLNIGTPNVPNYQLFNGQADGTIEQEYSTVQYKGQDVPATLVSGYILAAAEYKNVNSIRFWLKSYNSYGGTVVITVITDDNSSSAQSVTMTVPAAPFDSAAFDPRYFECIVPLDFQVININTNYRWLQYTMFCTTGSISLQKVELLGEMLENQEG